MIFEKLILPEDQKDIILRLCDLASPFETCGLLAGKDQTVEKVISITNSSAYPRTRYFMNPEELIAAFFLIDSHGQEVVGMFHSHPFSPPFPSPTDIAECSYPDIPQVIAGKTQQDWDIKAFAIKDYSVIESKLEFLAQQ